VRAFVAWLRSVRLTNNPDEAISEADFARDLRQAWTAGGELSGVAPGTLAIPTGRESDYLRLAFRIWTTELRPTIGGLGDYASPPGEGLLSPPDDDCACLSNVGCAHPPREGCIALATLSFSLTADRREVRDTPEITDEAAPFLLHLRMLQEWLISGRHDAVPSDTVLAETVYDLAPDAGVAAEYARADHTHGSPPPPELLGEVESLPDEPGSPVELAAEGSYRLHTRVARIYGEAVGVPDLSTTPTAGQVLKLIDIGDDTLEWRPADDTAGTSGPEPGGAIVPEQLYGQAPNPGVATTYAPSDHTHGTPPAPTFGGEVEFELLASTETQQSYDTRVAAILGFPVEGTDHIPAAGDVLTLVEVDPGKFVWQLGSRGGAPDSFVVAAGQFRADGSRIFAHRQLRATPLEPNFRTAYLLTFEEFDLEGQYVVTGAPWTNLDNEMATVFEYIGDTRDDKVRSRIEEVAQQNDRVKEIVDIFGLERAGFVVRVMQINTEPISNGFMVEISRYPREG
jgi:hypothetical protein